MSQPFASNSIALPGEKSIPPGASVPVELCLVTKVGEIPFLDTLAHHNVSLPTDNIESIIEDTITIKGKEPYGVQRACQLLTKSQVSHHETEIRAILRGILGISGRSQREAALCLLRMYAHYGKVYPKASTVAESEELSIRTFWYAVKKLKEAGVLETSKQFFNGYQTSSYYHMNKLALLVCQYLAEKGRKVTRFARQLLREFNDFWLEFWESEFIVWDGGKGFKLKLPSEAL